MSQKYMDKLYSDAQKRQQKRKHIEEYYNTVQKEQFKENAFRMFQLSQDSIFIGMVVALSTMFIFKLWVIWSIVKAFL